jgi:hypothetical protein
MHAHNAAGKHPKLAARNMRDSSPSTEEAETAIAAAARHRHASRAMHLPHIQDIVL